MALLVVVLGGSKSGAAEKALRDELREGRRESQQASRDLREELSGGLKAGNETLSKTLADCSQVQNKRLEEEEREKALAEVSPRSSSCRIQAAVRVTPGGGVRVTIRGLRRGEPARLLQQGRG